MSLKTTVIVNEITNLSEARYCAGMGVQVLGFKFDGLEKSQQTFNEISPWVAGVDFSGIVDEDDPNLVQSILLENTLSFIQTPFTSVVEALQHLEIRFILKIEITDGEMAGNLVHTLAAYHELVHYFILECNDKNMHGSIFSLLHDSPYKEKLILGFGFEAENVLEVMERLAIGGIILRGTEEERPGFHDYGDLMDVLEALED